MRRDGDIARFPLLEAGSSELAGLIRIVRRLSTCGSVDEVMEVATYAARTLLQADGITFVRRDGDLCHYAEEDAISPLWKGRRFPIEACISGWCMMEAKTAVIPDILKDPRIPQDAYRPTFVRSLAMVPVCQDEPVAALGAYWASVTEISPEKVELLQTVANAAALALARVELKRGMVQDHPSLPVDGVSSHSTPIKAAPAAERRGSLFLRLRPHSPEAYAVAVVSVSVTTMFRLWLDVAVGSGLSPFVIYSPAVLISALLAGVPSGVLALAYGGLLTWWLFLPPAFGFALHDPAQVVNLALYTISSALIIWLAARCRKAFLALSKEQEKRTLLHHELRHRMKNAFAVVQAIVSQSLRASPEEARKINGRISALTSSNEMLGETEAHRSYLESILKAELEPYGPSRVELHGTPINLSPADAQAFALVVHELATNAAKYGALSTPQGRLLISWSASAGRLRVTWTECGGPPAAVPSRSGFGTSFVERLLAGANGSIARDFRPEGLVCVIELALSD